MMSARGMHDIKTHGTLAREGRLISVARDLHRINKRGFSEEGSWDGSVDSTVYRRPAQTQRPVRDLFHEIALGRKTLGQQMANIREFVAEMEEFVQEGIPGAANELSRLRERLSALSAEQN